MKTSLRYAVTLLVLSCFAGIDAAHAVVISSAPFSLGYGFTGEGNGFWTTIETAGANTPTTQGGFSFVPTVTGPGYDGTGPTFPGRVLTDANNGFSGWSHNFGVSVTGAYTGPLAALGAAPIPNYRVQVNISQISIYAAVYLTDGSLIRFSETTFGHTAMSPNQTIQQGNGGTWLNSAGNYAQLVWNPDDYEEAGTSFTRTFGVVVDGHKGLDGFEIFGTVDLIYDVLPAPEPSTATLLALGALGIVRVGRRRRGRA